MSEQVVGTRVPRIEARGKVTGKFLYGTDVKIHGMLYGKVLRSSFAHARILHVDTSAAEKLLGVKAVVTGSDLTERYGVALQDQPCYCSDKVRYIGDPVAGVAAVDIDTANEALGLIRVEYEELTPVFDPEKAMEPGAPLVHERLGEYVHHPSYFPVTGTNICNHFALRKGDIEEGFRQSDLVLEETYTTQRVQHCALEPHVSMAQFSQGQATIWSSTQNPHTIRREMARILGLPINRVRVIATGIGGAFGSKTSPKVEPLALALAMKVKNHQPVKITLTREEEFYATSVVRHPSIITIKAGVRRDGTLLALQSRVIFDTGAYADVGPVVARSAGMAMTGPYRVPNVSGDAYCVYTNNPISGAFRGFGVPQVMWAMDSHMDALALGIGMDPLELRLKNALEEGDVSATGQVLHSVGIKECIRQASAGIEWSRKSGRYRGKGMGTLYKMTQTPSSSSAIVKVSEDGSVDVLSSTVDMGQGSSTILAQIVAEELGADMASIRVIAPDTDVTPFDHGTASSRSTFHMGNAVRVAAAEARKQLLETASEIIEARPEDLEIRNGLIFVRGTAGPALPIAQVPMGLSYEKGKPIIGHGTYTVPEATPLDRETGQGGDYSVIFWLYGAQAVEVEVDIATGIVTVLKVVAAHDLGRVINPLNVEQQIEGGILTGIGFALTEELVLRAGKPINANFIDYRVPTSMDFPEMKSIFVEAPHRDGPYGAKGVGEPAIAPTAPAIGNAVFDAIGIRIRDLPITPEKILRALKEKGQEGK